ncbi:helicase associated domain-containing protein [Mycobacteroides abscessus]|uniref:helicase associated domain-containing protein n=1 Tax=Mycobacteroides abscessus TaxID=36809 RepID=UPI0005E0DDA9|nr:helicase associated domain-containing protein [Mycobacteroides abscessus]CPW72681.1 putative helicase [Mycobacteroides abscessus]SKF61090.1 putative helicase [Mycobacteroides abscessus subsp. bolletii]SKH64404.1 putative helicase [Mycobacteroides abscessus subsp. bolletii]
MNFGDQPNSAPQGASSLADHLWARHIAALARMNCAPGPETEMYAWLVWQWCRHERGCLTPAHRAALEALPEPVRQLREDRWVRRFLELAARERAGLSLAGDRRTPWLTYQRRLQNRRMLPASRVALLERLDSFDWNPGDRRWWSTFEEVSRFAAQHERLPTRRDSEQLANWVAVQRFQLRSDRLRYDRARALASLPGWRKALAQTRSRSPWERRCEQLRVFIQTHKRYPLLDSSDTGEAALARWVLTQREQYRRDGLSTYRIQMLSALPFWRWGAREQVWDTRFRKLAKDVRRGRFGPGHPDYGWVIAQRRHYRVGRLTTEQADLLRSLNLLGSRLSAAA